MTTPDDLQTPGQGIPPSGARVDPASHRVEGIIIEGDTALRVKKANQLGRTGLALLIVGVLVGVAMVAVVAFGMIKIIDISQTTQEISVNRLGVGEDLRDLLETADSLTSPEATAASQQRLANTLQIVLDSADCDNREVVQQLAEELVEAGVLRGGDLQLRCPFEPPDLPGDLDNDLLLPTTTTIAAPPVEPGG